MFGRKKVDRTAEADEHTLATAISELGDPHREHALKDIHLVSAASFADGVVLSCDDAARRAFALLGALPAVRALLWANPEKQGDRLVDWLARGAPDEQEFRLIP